MDSQFSTLRLSAKAKRRGQASLLLLIVLLPVLAFLLSNIQMSDLGNKKIQHQSQVDALGLNLWITQAQALNHLAIYNEGLKIAEERAYLMAVALLTLRACAFVTLGNPLCTKAYLRLEREALPFFRKLQKLVDHIAKQQDLIIQWAQESPQLAINHYRLLHGTNAYFITHPKLIDLKMPVMRQGSVSDCDINHKEKPCFAQGFDVKRCQHHSFGNWLAFQTAKKNIAVQFSPADEILLSYRARSSQSHVVLRIHQAHEISQLKAYLIDAKLDEPHVFEKAVWRKCLSFYSLLDKLAGGIALRVHIPKPYELSSDFFEPGHQLALASTLHPKPLPVSSWISLSKPNDLWAISQVMIKGYRLDKPNFDVELTPLTRNLELAREIEAHSTALSSLGFSLLRKDSLGQVNH